MLKTAALFLPLFFALLSSVDAAQVSLTPEQQELFLSYSVKLRVDADNVHSWGTGTVIDTRSGEALILTCGHIFRERFQQNNNNTAGNNITGNASVEVHLYGGRNSAKVDGYCIFCDLETDTALIAVKPPFPVQAAAVAPEGYVFQSGQTVWSSGCGGGSNPSLVQHQIMSLDKISPMPSGSGQNVPFHYIQVSGAPVCGRSGGGLFTADNYLIGVCNTGDPQNNDGHFVPAEVIRHILKSMRLEAVYNHPSLRDSSTAKIEPAADVFPKLNTALDIPQAMLFNDKIASNTAADSSQPATLLPLHPIAEKEENGVISLSASSTPNSGMNNVEQATLEEIRRRAQDGDEIILIVRSRRNPEIPSDVVVLNGTSDQFLNQLARNSAKVPNKTNYEPAILSSALPSQSLPAQVYAGDTTGNTAQTGSQPVSFPVFHR